MNYSRAGTAVTDGWIVPLAMRWSLYLLPWCLAVWFFRHSLLVLGWLPMLLLFFIPVREGAEPGAIVIGWLIYISIGVALIRSKRPKWFFPIYGVFLLILTLNIGVMMWGVFQMGPQ